MEEQIPIASLKFGKPAYVELELNEVKVQIDVYEARRVLELSDKQPTYDAKWNYVSDWLKKQFGIETNEPLANNLLYEFNDFIVNIVIALDKERQSKISGIHFLQQPIQVSPMSTENGV